jgi:hypothetical protein
VKSIAARCVVLSISRTGSFPHQHIFDFILFSVNKFSHVNRSNYGSGFQAKSIREGFWKVGTLVASLGDYSGRRTVLAAIKPLSFGMSTPDFEKIAVVLRMEILRRDVIIFQ